MELIFFVAFVLTVISIFVGLASAIDLDGLGCFALVVPVVFCLMAGLAMESKQNLCYRIEAEVGKPVKACNNLLDREED